MTTTTERMRELVDILNNAARIYYDGTDESPITDHEYDALLKELTALERSTLTMLKDSPNNIVGYLNYTDQDPIHKHDYPILSLKDTKDIFELQKFLGEEDGLLSWKLDGASIVLYYNNGRLRHALTRGDGEYGTLITGSVYNMPSVPFTINYDGPLIVRGEGVISLNDFDQIKRTKEGEKYSNIRNTAAGLIRSFKTPSVLLRHVTFVAHSIVHIDGPGRGLATRDEQLHKLMRLGFRVVPYIIVANYQLVGAVKRFTADVEDYEFPVDGLVLTFNNISYAESKGVTKHHPKHSMAFKWEDPEYESTAIGVRWSVSRTGLITPSLIIEPVSIDGTVVRRINLHNLKKFKEFGLGKGDRVIFHKANKIIPELLRNLDGTGTFEYPDICPVCSNETTVVRTDKTEKLYCYACSAH